jgi:hypothetical protein
VTPAQAFVERHFSVAEIGNAFGVRWEAQRHSAFLLRKGLARGKSAVVAWLAGAVQKTATKRCPKRIRSFVVSLKSKKQHLNQETKA